jgi:hypothetical protein
MLACWMRIPRFAATPSPRTTTCAPAGATPRSTPIDARTAHPRAVRLAGTNAPGPAAASISPSHLPAPAAARRQFRATSFSAPAMSAPAAKTALNAANLRSCLTSEARSAAIATAMAMSGWPPKPSSRPAQ